MSINSRAFHSINTISLFNDLYHFCNPAPVNSRWLHLALIDGTPSGLPSPRQILRFLPFRDQWPDLGLPGVPWLLPEPHRAHLNGRCANKLGVHPPLGLFLGPNFGPEALTLSTSCANSSMIYIFWAFRVHLHAMIRIMSV